MVGRRGHRKKKDSFWCAQSQVEHLWFHGVLLFLLHPPHNPPNNSVTIWSVVSTGMEGAVPDINCLFLLTICSNNFSKNLGKKGKRFCMFCFCAHLPVSLSGCSMLPLKAQQSVWSSLVLLYIKIRVGMFLKLDVLKLCEVRSGDEM